MGKAFRVLEPLDREMRIDLRGGEALVAQELLDAPHIGTARKQLRREGMSEGVGRMACGVRVGSSPAELT